MILYHCETTGLPNNSFYWYSCLNWILYWYYNSHFLNLPFLATFISLSVSFLFLFVCFWNMSIDSWIFFVYSNVYLPPLLFLLYFSMFKFFQIIPNAIKFKKSLQQGIPKAKPIVKQYDWLEEIIIYQMVKDNIYNIQIRL